jgi:two-component system, chemotaxis family, chemotaxis protein CheY
LITAIVIDDEKDVLEVFCEYLKVKNIRVLGKGRNGKDALELYQKLKPDVVLMDLVMPQYDGFYGIENIRKHYSDSKIIIFSASLTPEYVDKLRKMNVSGISVKPYDMDRIIDLIDKVHAGKIVDLTL